MTPAQKLAKRKPTRKQRSIAAPRKTPWKCGIQAMRNELRLSLRDTAKAVGLSVSTLFIIEHCGDPLLTSAHRLAKFFGKSVEELWTVRDV